DGGSEAEAAATGETAAPLEEAPSAASTVLESESVRSEVELNEDQVAALASGFVEAKHEETQEEAEADAVVGGAEFDEEEAEEQSEDQAEETETTVVAEVSELSEEEVEEVEAGRAANRAEFAADVAQEHAEHHAAQGGHEHGEAEHVEHEHADHDQAEHERAEPEHSETEMISAAPGESLAEGAAVIEEDVILLPGEPRAPRVGGAPAPLEDFP